MARPRGRPPKKLGGRPPKLGKNVAKAPIALSDSEASDVDMPIRGAPLYPKDDDLIKDEDEVDGDAGEASGSGSGSEDEDEDIFVVEQIKQHLVEKAR